MNQPRVNKGRLAEIQRALQYPVFFVLIIGVFILGIKYSTTLSPAPTTSIDKSSRLDACALTVRDEFFRTYSTRVEALNAMTKYCYTDVYMQDNLWDYEVRRTSFTIQQYQGTVLLTVVVMVTISGVALSALQLFAAFQLAMEGREKLRADSQIGIEAGKMSVKSSVAGVVILSLSLLFFVVFVKYVFPITETNTVSSSMPQFGLPQLNGDSATIKGPELNSGGYGHPPSSSSPGAKTPAAEVRK